MKNNLTKKFLFICLPVLLCTNCKGVNTEEDYYYKENTVINNIPVEFYGKGYGTYGQLLPSYCTGKLEYIFDNENSLKIQTSSSDNSSPSYNEIYITLTINKEISGISTNFSTTDKSLISSFKISYTDKEQKEITLASTFKETSEYELNVYVGQIVLYVKQNKYYSSYEKDETKKNQLSCNEFCINHFILY